jgi:type VII secretion effector (TIGR04197 family)
VADEIIQSSVEVADSYIAPIKTAKDSVERPDTLTIHMPFSNLSARTQVLSLQQKTASCISGYDEALTTDLTNFETIAANFAEIDAHIALKISAA